jgi:hypothetical protein
MLFSITPLRASWPHTRRKKHSEVHRRCERQVTSKVIDGALYEDAPENMQVLPFQVPELLRVRRIVMG